MRVSSASPRSPSATKSMIGNKAAGTPDLLSKTEKDHFIQHQGETAKLSNRLCSIFGIPDKNTEVSKASNVTMSGIVLYLIHFVNREDANLDVHGVEINDIKKLYKKNGAKIEDAFRKHFAFKTNDFKVGWKRYADADDEDESEGIKADIVGAIRHAMTMMDMDFNAIDLRKQFIENHLTDYLLVQDDDEQLRQSFIEQLEQEQKEEEGMNVALPQNTNHKQAISANDEMELVKMGTIDAATP